ncbi:MAG: hypothetical protein A2Y38_13305 [Spirochaetes bacterium GWB1_59_5]|nr:MAG: hypothetical protein A2Y38_13305 [Spirochaetes bacterium GWB1_59_5]
MIHFKSAAVRVDAIHREIWLAISIADEVYEDFGIYSLTVTSLNDGEHRKGSKHYDGEAADLRIHNVPQAKRESLVARLAAKLGDDYDVAWESKGKANEHVHLEFDPV